MGLDKQIFFLERMIDGMVFDFLMADANDDNKWTARLNVIRKSRVRQLNNLVKQRERMQKINKIKSNEQIKSKD